MIEQLSPAFSGQDIQRFLDHQATNHDEGITSMLVSSEGVFAMKVDDPTVMQNYLVHYLTDIDEREYFKLRFEKKVLKPCANKSNSCYPEKFAKFIKKYKSKNGNLTLGINTFTAETTDDGNGCVDFNGWSKN